jgi:hypothetical protein
MATQLRRSLIVIPALACALALGACGDAHTRVTTGTYAGESGKQAPYLNLGPLAYQVQLSRQVNPTNIEDSAYLQGLTPLQRRLAPGQEWFAVFMQVFNNSKIPHPLSSNVTVYDTEGNVYAPIVPDLTNRFAYRAGQNVPGSGQLPQPSSVAANGGTQGLLLLFKIQVASLDNRPIRVRIVNPINVSQAASAELDV